MALDFNNVSLLGYSIQNEFLGDQSYNIRKVISLDIQGFLDDGKKAGNDQGVAESFRKINEQIQNGQDYWDEEIVLNGKSFGKGRVLGISFESAVGTTTDMIRYGQYTASLEVYKEGDLILSATNSNGVDEFAINQLKYNFQSM